MKDPCATFFGLIQMTDAVGGSRRVVLVTPSVRTFQKRSTTTTA